MDLWSPLALLGVELNTRPTTARKKCVDEEDRKHCAVDTLQLVQQASERMLPGPNVNRKSPSWVPALCGTGDQKTGGCSNQMTRPAFDDPYDLEISIHAIRTKREPESGRPLAVPK